MILDRLKKLELGEEEFNKNAEVFDDIFLKYEISEREKNSGNNVVNHTNNVFIKNIKKIHPLKIIKNLKIQYYNNKDNDKNSIDYEYGKDYNKYSYKHKNKKETITEKSKGEDTGKYTRYRNFSSTLFR